MEMIRIEDEVNIAVNRKIDLLTENSTSPYLVDTIHRDEVVIFGLKPRDPSVPRGEGNLPVLNFAQSGAFLIT